MSSKQVTLSLMMPVFNSFGYLRSNDRSLLANSIESLLRQQYKDFELIILDNQSTDRTADLCKSYEQQDPRVRYILDEKSRYPEEAISHLHSLSRGDYVAIVNDDDLWSEDYFSVLMATLKSNPKIDLAYGNLQYIDVDGRLLTSPQVRKNDCYDEKLGYRTSLFRFLNKRNVIPVSFGVFKSEVFGALMPYEHFDELKQNVDNLHIIKYLHDGFKTIFEPNVTFFYRTKDRSLETLKYSSLFKGVEDEVHVFLIFLRHQLLFLKRIERFQVDEMIVYQRVAFVASVRVLLNLIYGIRNDVQFIASDKLRFLLEWADELKMYSYPHDYKLNENDYVTDAVVLYHSVDSLLKDLRSMYCFGSVSQLCLESESLLNSFSKYYVGITPVKQFGAWRVLRMFSHRAVSFLISGRAPLSRYIYLWYLKIRYSRRLKYIFS